MMGAGPVSIAVLEPAVDYVLQRVNTDAVLIGSLIVALIVLI